MIVVVAESAHCPAKGVKVYVAVAVGSNTGFQLPVVPSLEVLIKGLEPPSQIVFISVKEVFKVVLIVTSKVCSLVQIGVVADSEYTNKVVEAEMISPAFSGVPLPFEAVK